jgi:hypothetical protein
MAKIILSPPKLGFVVLTRAAAALGLGLLVASKLSESRRRKLGRSLFALGALTTIPAVLTVLRNRTG